MPSRYKNLDSVFQLWSSKDLLKLDEDNQIKLDKEEKEVIV